MAHQQICECTCPRWVWRSLLTWLPQPQLLDVLSSKICCPHCRSSRGAPCVCNELQVQDERRKDCTCRPVDESRREFVQYSLPGHLSEYVQPVTTLQPPTGIQDISAVPSSCLQGCVLNSSNASRSPSPGACSLGGSTADKACPRRCYTSAKRVDVEVPHNTMHTSKGNHETQSMLHGDDSYYSIQHDGSSHSRKSGVHSNDVLENQPDMKPFTANLAPMPHVAQVAAMSDAKQVSAGVRVLQESNRLATDVGSEAARIASAGRTSPHSPRDTHTPVRDSHLLTRSERTSRIQDPLPQTMVSKKQTPGSVESPGVFIEDCSVRQHSERTSAEDGSEQPVGVHSVVPESDMQRLVPVTGDDILTYPGSMFTSSRTSDPRQQNSRHSGATPNAEWEQQQGDRSSQSRTTSDGRHAQHLEGTKGSERVIDQGPLINVFRSHQPQESQGFPISAPTEASLLQPELDVPPRETARFGIMWSTHQDLS